MRHLSELIIILLLVEVVLPDVLSVQKLYEDANKKYISGDYPGSIEIYKKIIDNDYESDKIYYNIGNAYYRMGKLGYSILYYEKALKLNPKNGDARFNLKLANLRIKDRIEVPPPFFLIDWYRNLKNIYSSSGWAKILSFWMLLLSFIFVGYNFISSTVIKRVLKFIIAVVAILLLINLVLLIDKFCDENTNNYGIVLIPSLECLSAPQEGSVVLFIIHEGLKVRVLYKEDQWLRIELPDGKQGWVRENTIGII